MQLAVMNTYMNVNLLMKIMECLPDLMVLWVKQLMAVRPGPILTILLMVLLMDSIPSITGILIPYMLEDIQETFGGLLTVELLGMRMIMVVVRFMTSGRFLRRRS